MPQVYDELRRVAHNQLRGERPGHTLNTTGLVHEAYAKLVDYRELDWQNRAHFYAVAAQAMRRILVSYARQKKAQKRGGGAARVTLDESLEAGTFSENWADELAALDEALNRLEALNPRHARIVECRFFANLSIKETAEALGVSPITVTRDWRMARAWLKDTLRDESDADSREAG
jgi:RNA polymerase sigma factor (TIGR02999 family)